MIGPFVQIVRQIMDTLLSFSSAIEKSREKETKRALLRLFFDLTDFASTVTRFLVHAKHSVSNRNRNSLQSAVIELRELHRKLELIITRFNSVMRSDASKYLLEVEAYRVGHTLDRAVGFDRYLLHAWSEGLDSFVVEVIRSVDALPSHLNTDVMLPALEEQDFLLDTFMKFPSREPRVRALRLSELVTETEIWLNSFSTTVESYRQLIKSQIHCKMFYNSSRGITTH